MYAICTRAIEATSTTRANGPHFTRSGCRHWPRRSQAGTGAGERVIYHRERRAVKGAKLRACASTARRTLCGSQTPWTFRSECNLPCPITTLDSISHPRTNCNRCPDFLVDMSSPTPFSLLKHLCTQLYRDIPHTPLTPHTPAPLLHHPRCTTRRRTPAIHRLLRRSTARSPPPRTAPYPATRTVIRPAAARISDLLSPRASCQRDRARALCIPTPSIRSRRQGKRYSRCCLLMRFA